MRKFSLFLCSLLVSLAIITACNHSNSKDKDKPNPGQNDELLKEMVTVQEAKVIIEENKNNENFVLLDVRTDAEFSEGYLVGHLPEVDDSETDLFKKQRGVLHHDRYAEDFASWLSTLDKSKRYLAYCRTDKRSKYAFDILKSLGFKRIQYMQGGYTKWATSGAGYKVHRPPYKKAVDVQIVGDKLKTNSTIKFDFLVTNLDDKPLRHAKLSLKVIPYAGGAAIETKEDKTGDDGKFTWTFDATSKAKADYKLVCEVTHKDSEGNDYEGVEAYYYFSIADADVAVTGNSNEIKPDKDDDKGEARAKKFYNRNIYGYKAYDSDKKIATISEKINPLKPTLMLFISTACGGCMDKAKDLVKYNLDAITVVPILTSVIKYEDAKKIEEIEKKINEIQNELKNTYGLSELIPNALYDAKDFIWDSRFKFGVTPQFVLINKDGQIKDIIYGGAEGVTMKSILDVMSTKFNLPPFVLK